MLKIDRHNKIEDELRAKGSILISQLSEKLCVSEETIRRDLKEMEQANKLCRIHGGAYLPETYTKGIPMQLRENYFVEEKELMARYVIKSYIKEKDFIMLDSSSTCLTLAKELLSVNMSLTIITNSLRICNLFNDTPSNIKLICPGGTLNTRNSSFIGYKTIDTLRTFVADKSFISCPSVDINHGLVDNSSDEGMVRFYMLKQSRERFLIVDHTKFSESTNVIFHDLSIIDAIVTDKKLSFEWERKCLELNIKVDCI